jgi:hypothetical protein
MCKPCQEKALKQAQAQNQNNGFVQTIIKNIFDLDKNTNVDLANIANSFQSIFFHNETELAKAKERMAICNDCENIQFSTNKITILLENKVYHSIFLPNALKEHKAEMFSECFLCKCNIVAKSFSKIDNCPLQKW